MMEENFWAVPEESAKVQKEHKFLENQLQEIKNVEELFELCELSCEMLELGEGLNKESKGYFTELEKILQELEVSTLLSGEYDKNSCVFSIQAGTGGLDAQDWAEMLLRMYRRYMSAAGFSVKVISLLDDEAAGIKHATLLVEGEYAYGKLKSEDGVHRLVRISPFNSSGKRQTSFASVEVYPEIEDGGDEIELNDDELKIDTYRSGGAGGQHVNTTDSAVRITHLPTGIVVQCQNERSQITNRETALRMLKSKLLEKKRREDKEKLSEIKGDSKDIAWGSQIRSYVLHPYSLVKDHRTGEETGNVGAVLDGEIENFIKAYLQWN